MNSSISKAVRLITSTLPLNWEKKEITADDSSEDVAAAYLSWMDEFTPLTLEFILDMLQGHLSCKVMLSLGAEQMSQIGSVESCLEFSKRQIQEVANRLNQIADPAVLLIDEKVSFSQIEAMMSEEGEVTFLCTPDHKFISFDLGQITQSLVEGAVPVRLQLRSNPKVLLTVRAE